MKTLIIGVDGASVDTFGRGWTPFIESLISNGHQLDLSIDVVSRGWVEVFSGKHALETGALYDLPLANKSLQWTTKFNMHQIPGWESETQPIWQVLNDRGYSVGIMNIPTTFPAPKVDGFFVSGGGGGARVVQEASGELCYPKDLVNYLDSVGYIVDQRMPDLYESKCVSAEEVASRFILKNQKRTEAFAQLSKVNNVDFGFVVYKTSSVMMEFFTLPELEKQLNGANNIDSNLLRISQHYYREFDKQIKYLVESFDGAEVIFVSDHSEVKTKFEVNVNHFLQENGFQVMSKRNETIAKKAAQYAKYLVKSKMPNSIIKKIRMLRGGLAKSVPTKVNDKDFPFERSKTSAFCVPKGDWVKGIYINDEERFGGIVPTNRIYDMAYAVSDRINSDIVAQEHGISSHVKPRTDSPVSRYYPDVILDVPEGYIVSNNKNGFITSFEGVNRDDINVDTIEIWLKEMAKGNWLPLTVRGYHPIAVSTKKWSAGILNASKDLTAVYRHIISQYK